MAHTKTPNNSDLWATVTKLFRFITWLPRSCKAHSEMHLIYARVKYLYWLQHNISKVTARKLLSMSRQDSCRSTSKCDEPVSKERCVLMMIIIMLMAIKMTARLLNDEEPAPSVRSCILLLHRNHRAPSNLCHSEPSSFLYWTLIKLKHASVQELRNHYKSHPASPLIRDGHPHGSTDLYKILKIWN